VSDSELRYTVGSDNGSGSITVHLGSHANWSSSSIKAGNAPDSVLLLGNTQGQWSSGATYAIALDSAALPAEKLTLLMDMGSDANDISIAASESGDNAPTLTLKGGRGFCDNYASTQSQPDASVESPAPAPAPEVAPAPAAAEPEQSAPDQAEPEQPAPEEAAPEQSAPVAEEVTADNNGNPQPVAPVAPPTNAQEPDANASPFVVIDGPDNSAAPDNGTPPDNATEPHAEVPVITNAGVSTEAVVATAVSDSGGSTGGGAFGQLTLLLCLLTLGFRVTERRNRQTS